MDALFVAIRTGGSEERMVNGISAAVEGHTLYSFIPTTTADFSISSSLGDRPEPGASWGERGRGGDD